MKISRIFSDLFIFSALLGVYLVSAPKAEAAGFPREQINTVTPPPGSNNTTPEFFFDDNNELHAVWVDYRHGSHNSEIYYAVSFDQGESWINNARVAAMPGHQNSPTVTACDNDAFVSWSNAGGGIYTSKSVNSGTTWSTPVLVHSGGINPDTVFGDGCNVQMAFAYGSQPLVSNAKSIYFTNSDDGVTWTTPVLVDHSSADANYPTIFVDQSESHYKINIGWQDRGSYPYTNIYYNFSTDGGTTWQSEDILVSGEHPGEGVGDVVDFAYEKIAGEYMLVAAWTAGTDSAAYPYVSYVKEGTEWASRKRVSGPAGDSKVATNANIEMLNGRIVVIWDHDSLGDREIRASYSNNYDNFTGEAILMVEGEGSQGFQGGRHEYSTYLGTERVILAFEEDPHIYSSIYNLPDDKLVFVTSQKYSGNLGGLSGANSICQARGIEAGYTGTFKAWVSTSTVSAASQIPNGVAFRLLNGTLVADNKIDLLDGTVDNPINLTELNAVVTGTTGNERVFTGTNPNGTANASTCQNWTSNSSLQNGRWGDTLSTNSYWTSRGSVACSNLRRLYCFQVAD